MSSRKRPLAAPVCLVLALLCGCGGPAAAQPRPLGRTSTHPRGIDAETLERSVAIEIDEAGRVTRRERRLWKILTDYGLDWHSDPEIVFDSDRQALDIEVARTVRLDGTVTETPESGRNEVLPGPLAAAPALGHIRRTIVSMVGVEPGARAELELSLADRRPTPWAPGGVVAVAGPMPAARIDLTVRSARGTLRSACVRCDDTPSTSDDAGRQRHLWSFRDVGAFDTYELGPHLGDNRAPSSFVPRVVFSTAESWRAEVEALQRRIEQAAVPTDALRARVERLVRDEATSWGRVEALHRFVTQGVDVVHLEQRVLGYAPAPAARVLARSYGSELDVAVLLLSMLRTIGTEAQLVLLSDDSEIAEEVPWLGQLDHAQVIVPTPNGERWLSIDRPLALASTELDGDRWALRVDRPGPPLRLDAAAPEASSARAVVTMALARDLGISGELEASFGGAVNPYHRLGAAGRGGEETLDPIAATVAEGCGVESPVVRRFGLEGTTVHGRLSGRARGEGGDEAVVALGLPWPGIDALEHVDLREARHTALRLPGPRTLGARIIVTLPEGWSAIGLPRAVDQRTDAGWLRQEVTVDGRRVEVLRELGLSRRVVEPGPEADALRALLATAARLHREALLIDTRPGPTNADEP